MKSIFIFLTFFVLLTCWPDAFTQSLPSGENNKNHLKGDLIVHDPVMIKQDGTYYIFHTGHGVSMKHSNDRIHWKNYNRVFDKKELPDWHTEFIPEQNGHLWAPDIHYRDGKYHLYYSVSAWMNFNSSIGYASNTTLDTSDADYKWVDQGRVISFKNGGEGVNVIDPNVFVDEEGTPWLFYGSYQAGLRLVELEKETGHLKKDPPDITVITKSMGEGAYVIKSHGYYYIFASRGICCKGLESTYHVIMGRSKNLKGPYLNKEGESWVDNNHSLFMEGNYEEPGRGHNGFFAENDTLFIVYHAYTRSEEGKPMLNIRPVYVDEDGWPTIQQTGEVWKP